MHPAFFSACWFSRALICEGQVCGPSVRGGGWGWVRKGVSVGAEGAGSTQRGPTDQRASVQTIFGQILSSSRLKVFSLLFWEINHYACSHFWGHDINPWGRADGGQGYLTYSQKWNYFLVEEDIHPFIILPSLRPTVRQTSLAHIGQRQGIQPRQISSKHFLIKEVCAQCGAPTHNLEIRSLTLYWLSWLDIQGVFHPRAARKWRKWMTSINTFLWA